MTFLSVGKVFYCCTSEIFCNDAYLIVFWGHESAHLKHSKHKLDTILGYCFLFSIFTASAGHTDLQIPHFIQFSFLTTNLRLENKPAKLSKVPYGQRYLCHVEGTKNSVITTPSVVNIIRTGIFLPVIKIVAINPNKLIKTAYRKIGFLSQLGTSLRLILNFLYIQSVISIKVFIGHSQPQ